MANEIISVGIIGTGKMGARHANNIASRVTGAKLAAVMDTNLARARQIADQCGGAKQYSDALALINNTDVDAVVITSPDASHAQLAMACLEAKKPVLCEKPLATNQADAEKVVQMESQLQRRYIQVGLMREFDLAHQKVQQVLSAGTIGPALVFRGVHNNTDFGYIRSVEEMLSNSAVHDIHSARWLMGAEVASVFVQYIPADPQQPLSCRYLLLQLTFQNNALAIIQVNSDSGYGYEVDVEVIGETGSVSTNSLQSAIVRHNGSQAQQIDASWLSRFEQAYLTEIQAWVDAIKQGVSVGASAWDGYMASLVADAGLESAKHKKVIELAIRQCPDLYQR